MIFKKSKQENSINPKDIFSCKIEKSMNTIDWSYRDTWIPQDYSKTSQIGKFKLKKDTNSSNFKQICEITDKIDHYCWDDFNYRDYKLSNSQIKTILRFMLTYSTNLPIFDRRKIGFSRNCAYLSSLKDYNYEYTPTINNSTGRGQAIFKCTETGCEKIFTRAWNMLNHARLHKGIKPYDCRICHRNFTQKGNLKKHLRTHLLHWSKRRNKQHQWSNLIE